MSKHDAEGALRAARTVKLRFKERWMRRRNFDTP